MGPKTQQKKSPTRSKSPKKSEPANTTADNSSFFSSLLSEGEWKAMVAMLVPSDPYEELFVEQLEKMVKSGVRRRFSWLSKKDIIDLINENTGKKGAAKKANALSIPLPQQLLTTIESVKPFIENKEEIPDSLMAQLIKGKLLHIKAIEKEKELARANRTDKKQPNVNKTAVKKDKSPTGKKSPTKGGKKAAPGGGGPLPDIDKQTQLKRKEDIEDEEKYIDDEPRDGPNHYILLSGFYSPTLLNYLDEFNLPIDCLIKFKSQDSAEIFKYILEIDEREKLETNLKANLKINPDSEKSGSINVEELSELKKSYYVKLNDDLTKYWSEIGTILEKSVDKQLIQHMANLKFHLKSSPNMKSWFEIDTRNTFFERIYKDLAERLFTLVVQKRHYSFYINNLKLYSIPAVNAVFSYPNQPLAANQAAVPPTTDADKFYDIRYYNELMNTVPAEYVSPAIILHCMVEQVVANEEKKPLPSEVETEQLKSFQTETGLSKDVSSHLRNMLDELALNEQEKNQIVNIVPLKSDEDRSEGNRPKNSTPPASSSPYLVNYNDDIGHRLKGVFEDKTLKKVKTPHKLLFDPTQIETDMLSKSLWSVFTGLPMVSSKVARERAARLQELLHFCASAEITHADVDRAFKQFVFETMNLTDVDATRKNYVKKADSDLLIPWDDPYPNISAALSEEKQLILKTLNSIDAKRELDEEMSRKKSNRVSSASTTKSIRFQDTDLSNEKDMPSSILKSRSSTKLSVQSVHFPDSYDMDLNEQINELVTPKTVDQIVGFINSTRKRDLTNWNFAEHYEPKVLVQVLQKTSYTHPYVDTYYNRRDNSLMLVFSNPHDDYNLTNHEEWTVKLHSNVGFRNYLEKIYEMIVDWTRDEEAKYQATLIAKEVDSFRSESSLDTSGAAQKPKPAESPSRSRSSSKNNKPTKVSSSMEKKKDGALVDKTSLDDTAQGPAEAAESTGEYITDSFIGHNSLKAWKMEHAKEQKTETQAKDRKKAKSPKGGNKSPNKDKSPPAKNNDNNNKTPRAKKGSPAKDPAAQATNRPKSTSNERGKDTPKPKSPSRLDSPKNKKTSRSSSKVESDKASSIQSGSQKANNQFIGYEVGNNMIYVKSHLSHMFPSNGALIKTERHLYKSTGHINVTSSVIVDGNTLSVHLVDPKDDKADSTKTKSDENVARTPCTADLNDSNDSIAKYTCFTGVFKDGLTLSYSANSIKYTPRQSNALENLSQTELNALHNLAQQQAAAAAEEKEKQVKKGKKGNKKDITPESTPELKEETPPKYSVLPWYQLHVSLPTGLSCTFLPETYAGVPPTGDNQPHRVVIKQTYTSKYSEKASEHFKTINPCIFKENSRLIRSDGTVIKFMSDHSVEIYYANGTIYRKYDEVVHENMDTTIMDPIEIEQGTKSKQQIKKKESQKIDEPIVFEPKVKPKWSVITPSGHEYLLNKEDKTHMLKMNHRIIQARDIQSGEVMVTREDQLKMVYRPDGSTLAEFADGTRITMFYVYGEINSTTGNDQQANLLASSSSNTSDKFKPEKYVKIECPSFATTIFNARTSECSLAFANGSLLSCDPKRVYYTLIHSTGELIEVHPNGSISFLPNGGQLSRNRFYFNQNSNVVLEHEDESGNKFKVSKMGKNQIVPVTAMNSNQAKPKRGQIKNYGKHSPRFFIIHKDSSGTELLRPEDVAEYLNEVEVDPMTAIIRDNIQGYPGILGTTALRPIKDCLSDTWFSEYDERDITPVGLRCRNLMTFPANPEAKVASQSKFAANIGRGLNIDLNSKNARFVKNSPIVMSKRMEYRQLIQYQKVTEDIRVKLINGLKNYINYISERAENHRLLLTYDPRTEAEKLTAQKILELSKVDKLLNANVSELYKKTVSKNRIHDIGVNISAINRLLLRTKTKKQQDLERELAQEKQDRSAWKNYVVQPYFESEWGKQFLYAKNRSGDQQQATNVPDNMDADNSNNRRQSQTMINDDKENTFLQTSENDFIQNNKSSMENLSSSRIEQVSPSANAKSINKSQILTLSVKDKNENCENFQRYAPKFKHSNRIDSSKLPNAIKTTRPNALPNITFLSTEEPVRRKTRTSGVQAGVLNGKSLDLRRGCEVYPKEVKFGTLREGFTYITEFEIVNVGIDSCRFKIKQPPPETGIKIMFKPGPIAAGMNRDLTIMMLAIYQQDDNATGGGGDSTNSNLRSINFNLDIVTETDLIKLPIRAQVATAEQFRNMFKGNLEAGKEKNIRILSVRPGSTKEVLTKPFVNALINNNKNNTTTDLLDRQISNDIENALNSNADSFDNLDQ